MSELFAHVHLILVSMAIGILIGAITLLWSLRRISRSRPSEWLEL